MIAYNKGWLKNMYLQEQAREALANNCISKDDYQYLVENHPVGFQTHNIYWRIGHALLTLLVLSFTSGLFSWVFTLFNNFSLILIGSGIVYYGLLEMLIIKRMNHYNSGADNMVALLSVSCLIGGFFSIFYTYDNPNWLPIAFFTFIICLLMAIRLVDSILSMAAAFSWLAFVLLAYLKLGSFATVTAPFVLMIASLVIYIMANRSRYSRTLLLYRNCNLYVAGLALVCLYLAGNYYVVSELGRMLLDGGDNRAGGLPMGWLFWGWTILIPVVYIGLGIAKKDILLIRIGLVLVAFSVATYRYYYSILSPDKALILAGFLLVVVGGGLLVYLKIPSVGFTIVDAPIFKEENEIEELLRGQVIQKTVGGDHTNEQQESGNSW